MSISLRVQSVKNHTHQDKSIYKCVLREPYSFQIIHCPPDLVRSKINVTNLLVQIVCI